jgi:hypothetical protein
MRTKILCCLISVVLAVCFAVPAMAANVSQGKCITNDQAKKTVTIEEYGLKKTKDHKYGEPTGKQLTFDCKDALIGITPAPGDILRIAWQEKDGKKTAVRIMNVSKQDLMKK